VATAAQTKAKEMANKLRSQLAELERAAGIAKLGAESERERDAKRKAVKRAEGRNIYVPPIKDIKLRKELEEDDCAWLQWYFPDVFYNPFTSDQRGIIESARHSLRYGSSKCVAAPRRDGKSTITKYLSLKYSLQRIVRFPLILCATGPKADDALKSIKARLRMINHRLIDSYPLECHIARYVAAAPAKANAVTVSYEDKLLERFLDHERVIVEWRDERIILPAFECDGTMGPIMMALPWSSDHIQGLNVFDIRPDFVMLDDLDSRESLAAEDGKIAGKIEQIIDKNLSGLGGQSRRLGIFYLCTITSRRSAAYKYSDPQQKPVFSGVRTKRLKVYPSRMDLWEQYIALRQKGQNTFGENGQPIDPLGREAHRFYLANQAEMNRGAELSNEFDFNQEVAPDGSQMQASALQMCFDFIANNGEEAFQTEHQNDPPKEDDVEQLVLTAYHVQHSCRSGLEQKIVPLDTVAIVAGIDVKKLGLHFVVFAFNDRASGCCIDYGFHEINTEGKDWKAVEIAILRGLHDWREQRDADPYIDVDGCERSIDLGLIDAGWKHESWAGQPVERFCLETGFRRFLPCKGIPNYRTPKASRFVHPGDNWHLSMADGPPLIVMNTDHWKQKVHEGFLTKGGQPGSLTLFQPSESRAQPHMSYAKHITSEVWETRFKRGFNALVQGWYKVGSQNHWFDATYQALVARALRGISTLAPPTQAFVPAMPAIQSASAPQLMGSESAGRNRW
jgi:hypothetical protein